MTFCIAVGSMPSAVAASHDVAYHAQLTFMAVSWSPTVICVCAGSVEANAGFAKCRSNAAAAGGLPLGS